MHIDILLRCLAIGKIRLPAVGENAGTVIWIFASDAEREVDTISGIAVRANVYDVQTADTTYRPVT